jgi:hypothetical protein
MLAEIDMITAQIQFLELLKAGLWGRPADPALFPIGYTDWNTVLDIAMAQTVAVIITDGIETLPADRWPKKDVMMRLMMLRVKTGQMHQLLNTTINQVVNALTAENIPSVLLKGQGAAQNYIKPESRSCGDIDIYTGTEGYERACEIISCMNQTKHKAGEESSRHMHLYLNGVEIEVHRLASSMPGKKLNGSFQNWTKASIDDNFGSDELKSWDNNGTKISLATQTFDAFFILYHAVRHMFSEGVGFRQICDWTMFLHRHHTEINSTELAKRLKEFHLNDIWREFSILAVNVLGLPVNELPIYPEGMCTDARGQLTGSTKTDIILSHIFISGNFGRFDHKGRDRSKVPYLTRKWRSFRFQSLRLIKLYGIFPKYTSSYMWNWLTSALLRVVTLKD